MIHGNILSTTVLVFSRGREGVLNKISYGKAPPRGPAPYSNTGYHF